MSIWSEPHDDVQEVSTRIGGSQYVTGIVKSPLFALEAPYPLKLRTNYVDQDPKIENLMTAKGKKHISFQQDHFRFYLSNEELQIIDESGKKVNLEQGLVNTFKAKVREMHNPEMTVLFDTLLVQAAQTSGDPVLQEVINQLDN